MREVSHLRHTSHPERKGLGENLYTQRGESPCPCLIFMIISGHTLLPAPKIMKQHPEEACAVFQVLLAMAEPAPAAALVHAVLPSLLR